MWGIHIRILRTFIKFFLHQIEGVQQDISEIATDSLLI